MKHKKANLLSATFFALFCSYGQTKSDKEMAMLFLSRIDSLTSMIDIKGNLFDQYNQKTNQEFIANNRNPVPVEKVDSLKKYFADYMSEIGNCILKLGKIQEYDNNFNLIRNNIDYWSSEKIFWEKYVPPIISLYQNGSNLTTEQRNEIIASFVAMKAGEDSQIKLGDDLTQRFKEFSNAHGFEYVQKRK